MNSVHAIADADTSDSGLVVVDVNRDTETFPERAGGEQPIDHFTVTDNGIGLDEDNWRSFNVADSAHKAKRGGRGLGRFLFLVVFRDVEIESTYQEAGEWRRRSFLFKKTFEGAENHTDEPTQDSIRKTVVRLRSIREKYRTNLPRTAREIGEQVVRHFLTQYVLGSMPRVVIRDTVAAETVELSEVYDSLVDNSRVTEFEFLGQPFELRHFILTPNGKMRHVVALCADGRKVEEWNRLDRDIPHLRGSLASAVEAGLAQADPDQRLREFESKSNVFYAGYLTGPFLDRHVDPSNRSRIVFPREASEITEDALRKATLLHSQEYLDPFLAVVRKAVQDKVVHYVETSMAEYRAVLTYRPDVFDRIRLSDSRDKIDSVLHEAQRELRAEATKTAQKLKNSTDPAESAEALEGFLQKWNEIGQSELAQYVLWRYNTLRLLGSFLRSDAKGKASSEDSVHSLIYPMKATSDVVDNHNLWLLDERLSFHSYLASDVAFSAYESRGIQSLKRPDITVIQEFPKPQVFDEPVAMVEQDHGPFASISLFEFKKPLRNDYSADGPKGNPVSQLYDYVRRIRSGEEKTYKGRRIVVNEGTRYHLYAVADLTKSLRLALEDMNLKETTDKEGYYGTNEAINATVEVVSWDKLLEDAKRRNRILFHKLRLPQLDA